MIERYITSEMRGVFTDQARFESYLQVELAVLRAYSEKGLISRLDFEKTAQKAHINLKRIAELEAVTKHDVVAFTRSITENLGDEGKFFHFGLTSTDVVDTGMALLYRRADDLIEKAFNGLLDSLRNIALRYKDQIAVARTHGMHAEATSFGLRFANFYDEGRRALESFKEVRPLIECAKLSGATGDFACIDPDIQDKAASYLGLTPAPIASQVLSRDRHARYASSVALAGGLVEKIAVEIRNLSRTEIGEVEEGFSNGQKGSSAMPQKRNPVSSENLTGCARMLRGYLLPIMEDEALYHERDISHSSVERVALQDLIVLFEYMLKRLSRVLDGLVFFPDRMERNLEITHGAIYAQRALNALILKGLKRDEAYDLIQPLAMLALRGSKGFKALLEEEARVASLLSEEEIGDLFDPSFALKYVDEIYEAVGLK